MVIIKCIWCSFQDEAGINSIEMEALPPYSDIAQVALPGAPYFHAELPSGDQIFAKTKQHFPLQFGRFLSSLVFLGFRI